MNDLLERLPEPEQLRERLRANLRERFALRRLLRLIADLAETADADAQPETPEAREVRHDA